MTIITQAPGAIIPMPAVARILSRYDRAKLEAFVSVAIDLLDVMDGDPDAETGNDLEDDFALSENALAWEDGPGCTIADKDAGAYVEWHTRPANSRRHGGPESMIGHEDDEEDDPAGQCDEDGINTAHDLIRYTPGSSGPGCPISDPDGCEEGV